MEKISMITISFNSEKTIEDTILSVLNQDVDDLEYVIVDGGSSDGTLAIIEKYRDKISHVISEKDKGISDAFNKGICAATGDVIGIINSDDILNKGAVRELQKTIEKKKADVYYGNILIRRSDGYTYRCKADKPIDELKRHFILFHPSCFIRKKAYEEYGCYDLNYKYAMDFELLSRMMIKGAVYQYIDFEMACFNKEGTSFKNSKKTTNESIAICVRNGVPHLSASIDYWWTNIKTMASLYLGKLGLEEKLRAQINNQRQVDYDYYWFRQ